LYAVHKAVGVISGIDADSIVEAARCTK